MGIIDKENALYLATGVDTTGLQEGKREVLEILQSLAKETGSTGMFSGMELAAVTAFTRAAAGIDGLARSFESGMAAVAGISPEMAAGLDVYEQRVIDMTRTLPVAADDCARSLYAIVAAGYDGSEAMDVLEIAARRAVAASASVSEAFSLMAGNGNPEVWAESLSAVDFSASIAGAEAQMQLLQNNLLAVIRKMGAQMTSQVAAVADRLGNALSGGSVEKGLRSLDTLVTLASGALADYRQAMVDTTGEITAEGAALEIAGEVRKAYDEVIAEGIAQREAVLAQEQAYRDGLAQTQVAEGAAGVTRGELIGQSMQLVEFLAKEIDQYRQKVLAQQDVVAALQQELTLNEGELTVAEKSVKSKEEVLSSIGGILNAKQREGVESDLMKARELQEAAAMDVSNTKRKLKSAEIQLNTLERRKETAVVVQGTLATGAEAAMNGVDTASTGVLTMAKKQLTVATVALGRAIAANPLGLLLSVVSLAISAFSLFGKKTEEVTSSVDKLNEATDKQKDYGSRLINTLYDQNEAESKRVAVLLELRKLYPQVWDKVNLANLAEMDRNKLIKEGNELLEEKRIKELEAQKAESEERLGELKKRVDKVVKIEDPEGGGIYVRDFAAEEAYEKEKKQLAGINKELEKRREIEAAMPKEALSKDEQLAQYKKDLADLTRQLEAVRDMRRRLAKEDPDNIAGDAKEYEEKLVKDIKEKKEGIELLEPTKKLTEEEKKSTEADINREQDAQKLKWEKEMQEQSLAVMSEGRKKRITEIDIEFKERGRLIDKEQKSLEEKYSKLGKTIPQEVAGVFEERRKLNRENLQKAIDEINQQNQEEVKQHKQEMGLRAEGKFSTEEERKGKEIKNKYEEEKTWAKNQKENGDLSEQELKDYNKMTKLAENAEQINRLKAELNDFEQRKQAVEAEWAAKRKTAESAGGSSDLLQKIDKEKEKALSSLGAEEIMASDEWENLFTNMDDLTVRQIDQLMENIQAKIDSKEPTLKSVDMKALTSKLEEAKQKIVTLNPFQAMASSMKDVFSKGSDESGKSSKEVEHQWKDLGTSTKGCFDFINDAVGNCSVLSDVLGESGQQTMGMIQGVATAGITMATAMKSVEDGSVVLAVIGAALTAVTAIASLFNKDKKQEKKIKGLQHEIDSLERAYDRLGTAIDNTFTEDVYRMMDEQNEKLQQQQVLIQQQIEAEGKKKKKDKDKINSWKNEIEDIDQKIEENKRKQIEMLAGTDVQSAINDFADALTEAYAKGEDGAKALGDTTKKVMANAVKEALKKKFLGESIQSAVNYLGESMKDGVLSKSEQSEFTRMVEEGGENYMKAMEAYGELFKDAYDSAPEGVSGQLQAAMTEGTASELVGLWTMTAMDIRVIREWLLTGTDVSLPQPGFDLSELLEQQYQIEQNTRMTVYQLRDGFGRMGQQLDAIERNTRGYYGRGR